MVKCASLLICMLGGRGGEGRGGEGESKNHFFFIMYSRLMTETMYDKSCKMF